MGLGNPGAEYEETRHNIGQRIVERIASSFRKRWTRDGDALLSRVEWRGDALHLVKPQTFMNLTGPVLARILRRLSLEPADCILVYDDIDLPLGTVRVRLRGSHGGHNGVRSIIDALGTEELRRVKVGIGRPEHKGLVPDHVLTGFDADELPAVEAACAAAVERILALAAGRP